MTSSVLNILKSRSKIAVLNKSLVMQFIRHANFILE
jgi:hypothetical protein